METPKNQTEVPPKPAMTSCRKKVKDDSTFFEDVKDHIDEFIHASMDEHKTCFQKTIKKERRTLNKNYSFVFTKYLRSDIEYGYYLRRSGQDKDLVNTYLNRVATRKLFRCCMVDTPGFYGACQGFHIGQLNEGWISYRHQGAVVYYMISLVGYIKGKM